MSKNNDIIIRYYQPGDEEKIVELLKKTFPKWTEFKDPLGLWKWKYIKTPLKNIIIVVEAGEKIVGCNHAVIFKAKLGSEISTIGYGDDLAVDTDYRGLGISTKMRSLKHEKQVVLVKYILSTTVNPILLKNWVKRNRKMFPFPVTRMVKTSDIDLQLQTRPMKNKPLVKLGYTGLKNLNKITNLFRTPIKRYDDFQIIQVQKFEENINSFWDRIKDDYNFILEKKQEYLNWRFTDNDRGNHAILQAVNGDEVLGYAVVGFKEGSSEGQIEDLIALKGRLDVADALLGVGCAYLDDLDMNSLFYQVVEGHPYQELCKRYGFIDSRSRPNVSFDYSANFMGDAEKDILFLENTAPSQVYFTYASTI